MYTLKTIAKHNTNFIDAFIDLKVAGWKSYEDAVNAYTYNVFAEQMTKQTALVEKFATFVKDFNKKTIEAI